MGEFRVSRSRHMSATPSRVHDHIDDFRAWTQWSPWEGLDPAMERRYSGPSRGVGSVYEWKGNKKAGRGRMEILDSSTHRVRVALSFIEPFASENVSHFELKPLGDGTSVTWTMTGPQSRLQKVIFTLLRMNANVAKDFDSGFDALAEAAERG